MGHIIYLTKMCIFVFVSAYTYKIKKLKKDKQQNFQSSVKEKFILTSIFLRTQVAIFSFSAPLSFNIIYESNKISESKSTQDHRQAEYIFTCHKNISKPISVGQLKTRKTQHLSDKYKFHTTLSKMRKEARSNVTLLFGR